MSRSLNRAAMIDDVQGYFKSEWDDATFTILGSVPDIFWERDTANPGPPTRGSVYAKLRILHTGGGQRSLGERGNRIFTRQCTLFIQLFFPLKQLEAVSREVVANAVSILEGNATPLGISFLHVVPTEVGQSEGLYQINVTADFEYDEVL